MQKMAFKLKKWKLIFMDGTVEEVKAFGLFSAWLQGKIRATEKKTVLLNVERVE